MNGITKAMDVTEYLKNMKKLFFNIKLIHSKLIQNCSTWNNFEKEIMQIIQDSKISIVPRGTILLKNIYLVVRKIFIIISILFLNNNYSYGLNNLDKICKYHGHIKKSPVNIRIGPSAEYKIAYIVNNNIFPISIQHVHPDNWCYIKTSILNKTGWVNCNTIKKSKTTFITCNVDIYRLPDGKQKFGKLQKGSKINILNCRSSWCKINLLQNKKVFGFIKKDCIWNMQCIAFDFLRESKSK